MLVIGERINATRSSIKSALKERDDDYIRTEAKQQAAAGADYIDVNGGASPDEELDNVLWLCEVVQDAVDVPLCIDSASPRVIKAGLAKNLKGRPMVNSISMEKGRYEDILPLVKQYDALVVALTMDDSGIPRSADDRIRVAEKIVEEAEKHGIALSDVYVDPLVMALSADTGAGMLAAEVIRRLGERWPGLKTTCGLSNISFGLPDRRLINRTYLAFLMAHGLSSAIIDPMDKQLMATVFAGRALRGEDEFCMAYLKAYRSGKLEA